MSKQGILLSLLLCAATATLQAKPNESSLGLSSAIKRTIELNPSLKVFEFRNTALKGAAEAAYLAPAYELELEAENFAGSGEFNGADSAEFTLSLSSVIEIGDKRHARTGVVSNTRSVLEARKQVKSLELLGEVTRRYVSVLTAQEQVSLAREAAGLANNTLDIVKERAAAGATPDAEVRRAEASVAQAKLTLLSEQQNLTYLKVALAALWGETVPSFSSVGGDLFHFGSDVGFDTLYSRVEKNPAIQIFAAKERLKDAEVRLAKTQSKGNFSWSVGVRHEQQSNDSALVAGFSVPLFSAKRNTSAVSAALAERSELFVQKEVALLNLHTQLFRAYHNRKQAILAAKTLQENIIPALKQALKGTQLAYQRGRYGYLEYVTAQEELLSARRMLIDAASTALIFGVEIEQLTAEPLSVSHYGESIEFPGVVK